MQDCENLSRTNGICFDVHVAGLPVGVSEVELGEVDVRVFLARRTRSKTSRSDHHTHT